MLLGDVVRYTMASAVIIVLGLVLGFRPDGGVLGVAAGRSALLLVFSFSLSWVWTDARADAAHAEKSVMEVSMMVLFPLTFLSNIFVDPETMPGWLQAFVNVNPISLLATAVRGLMHGRPAGDEIGAWSWC